MRNYLQAGHVSLKAKHRITRKNRISDFHLLNLLYNNCINDCRKIDRKAVSIDQNPKLDYLNLSTSYYRYK